ncbi:GPATCH1 [Blepharisma stoltei]|uniref:G patch domain-containing protein n=1 Tax=Blepharisma stoltei TaxID=1481888 RepID=A0AAU9JFN0_9CILI|nr:unnamed protein product [Blepharisma stoltei]
MKKKIKRIGTGFEDDKETTLTGRGLYPWEQKVADERTGKRKFHGAFTGGFSAGYNNTCGSEFGFQPAQFVSSRKNRNQVKQQVTDFMDEEDLGEFDLGKTLEAQEKEANLEGDKGEAKNEGIGNKLYSMMKKVEEPDAKRKCYGPTLPPEQMTEVDFQQENPKLDWFGLGFDSSKLQLEENLHESKNPKNRGSDKVKSLFKVSNDIYEENDYSFFEPDYEISVKEKKESNKNQKLKGEVPGFILSTTLKPSKIFKPPELPHNYNPIRFLLNFHSYRTIPAQKLDPEKRESIIEEQKKKEPLFANRLSESDREKIKSFKSFVKSSDLTERSARINKQDLPFKDDKVKHDRYYAFICNMEGLEVGGIAPARLMTASQIRQEKEEFLKLYEQWKKQQESKKTENEPKKNIPRWSDRTIEPWKPERVLCELFCVLEPQVAVIESRPVNTFREKVMPTVNSSEAQEKSDTPLLFRGNEKYSDLFKSIFEENEETDTNKVDNEINEIGLQTKRSKNREEIDSNLSN